jgi:ceramide glucosyltransferase
MDAPALLPALAIGASILAAAGIGQAVAGLRAVRRFSRDLPPPITALPPLTLLKPLYGDEPLLEVALASVCAQDYPEFQIVCGVQDAADPAIAVVRRLQARFAHRRIDLVINPTQHGKNRKVSNLINMSGAALHDVIVIADSDLHCPPDYLRRIIAEFAVPNTGLVTTLYAALAANTSLPARLGATAINHGFLPGALMSRDLNREDCLGATMALRRETLSAIGGLPALVDHLADDNVLGRLVRATGMRIRIATTVPATTVPESRLDQLFRHELRWSRTILSLVPVAFALSSVQFPLFWAGLAIVLSGAAPWAAALFAAAWIARAATAADIDRHLGLVEAGRATPVPSLLLPLRDLLSIAVILASYASDRVEWRGQMMHTGATNPSEPESSRQSQTELSSQGTVLS